LVIEQIRKRQQVFPLDIGQRGGNQPVRKSLAATLLSQRNRRPPPRVVAQPPCRNPQDLRISLIVTGRFGST